VHFSFCEQQKKAQIGVLFCILVEAGEEDGPAHTEPDFWRNNTENMPDSDDAF